MKTRSQFAASLSAPYGPLGRHSLWYAVADSSATAERAHLAASYQSECRPEGPNEALSAPDQMRRTLHQSECGPKGPYGALRPESEPEALSE